MAANSAYGESPNFGAVQRLEHIVELLWSNDR